MLNIDETQLKSLLEKRKRMIGRPKCSGMGEIISAISLMITLALSDFSHLSVIKPLYFKIIAWSISAAILLYGLCSFIKSLIDVYSAEQMYSEIADIDPSIEHPFDIVVIKNSRESGKYLVFKSKRWGCWLFPNYHCLDGTFSKAKETKHLKECVKRDLGLPEEIEFTYIGNDISEKFSVGDKVRKKYNFHYFQAGSTVTDFDSQQTFRRNGRTYAWKTLDQMYSSRNIVKKNRDVLDYIRRACDIS